MWSLLTPFQEPQLCAELSIQWRNPLETRLDFCSWEAPRLMEMVPLRSKTQAFVLTVHECFRFGGSGLL